MPLIGIEGPEGCSQWNLYGKLFCQGVFQSFHNLVSLLQGRWNEDKSVLLAHCPHLCRYRGEPARREQSLSRTCMRWVTRPEP
jgi:hypothetical protein